MPKRRKPAIVQQNETSIDGQTISYTLRRSFQARRLRIEISQRTGLVVTVPHSYPLKRLPELLKSKWHWISRQLNKFRRMQSLPPPKQLEPGDTVPYLGRDLVLVKLENRRGGVFRQGDKLIINPDLFENSRLEPALEQWYRTEAAVLLAGIADRLSSRLGIGYHRITIRSQKTRWASCSRQRNLSFNWRLIMAPEPIVEYVIIHELLHLKEMNHSEKFWELVARYCPTWRQHKKWLRQHEADLNFRFCTPSQPPVPEQLRLI
jgi:predicted metal-dependent hydrolase